MKFTAEKIASLVNGKVIGDPDIEVFGFSEIEEGKKGNLSFIAKEKYLPLINKTEASVVIISENLINKDKQYPSTLIAVEDGYIAFQILMNLYQDLQAKKKGIEQPTYISDSAKVMSDVYIGAFTYISDKSIIGEGTQIYPHVYIGENVKIGKNCRIYSGTRIYHDCVIGDNCFINSNTVIGADGFGFQSTADGFKKIPQLGNVILKDNVEIGSGCTIDRATIGSTIIGKGTKLDNLIQIAHNVKIGENNVIAAQTGIAGSTTIGDWNMIGGQTGIVGHISIGSQVKIQAQSGVNSNVEDKEVLYGSPAISATDFRRSYVHFRNFSTIVERINNLEKKNSKDITNE